MKGIFDLKQSIHLLIFTYLLHAWFRTTCRTWFSPSRLWVPRTESSHQFGWKCTSTEPPCPPSVGVILFMSAGHVDLVHLVCSLSQAEPRNLRLDPAASLLPCLRLQLQLGFQACDLETLHTLRVQ